MKILFYGDLQINNRYPTYMKFLDQTIEGLIAVIKTYNPDLVINLGDTMDTKDSLKTEDLVWAWKRIRRIEYECPIPTMSYASHWVIKGNHDISDKKGDIASVQVFDGMNTQIFLDPDLVETPIGNILVLPYTEDPSLIPDFISTCDPSSLQQVKAVVGHVDWVGCRLTPAFVSKTGLHPIEFLKNFSENTVAFNGHYHHPIDVGKLYIVGSPLHKDFNDVLTPIPRGFTWWDTETGLVSRIENPYTYYCVDLQFDDVDDMRKTAFSLDCNKDKMRLKVTVPMDMVDDAKETFDDCLHCSIVPVSGKVCSLYDGSGLGVTSSTKDIINKGIEAAPETLDRDLLLKTGRELFS